MHSYVNLCPHDPLVGQQACTRETGAPVSFREPGADTVDAVPPKQIATNLAYMDEENLNDIVQGRGQCV